MVLPSGTNDVSRVTTSTRLVAVVMPNQNGISSDWRSFRVSVDQVEAMTGYDFFSSVDPKIQSVIEASVDTMSVSAPEMELDQYAIDEIKAERKYNSIWTKRLD